MPSNIEIKARLADFAATRRLVEAIGDSPPEMLTQRDTFFRCSSGRLKLRELGSGACELIAYARVDVAGIKQSDYEVTPIADPESTKRVLRTALGETVVVEKTRLLFLIGQTRIHLDRVTGLGDFLELEVILAPGQTAAEGEAIASDLMQQLEIPGTALLAVAYADMLANPCREPAQDTP